MTLAKPALIGDDIALTTTMHKGSAMLTPAPAEQPRIEDEITVTARRIACDGGGALGHPRVWLNLGEDDAVTCPYCSRRFVLDPEAATAAAH